MPLGNGGTRSIAVSYRIHDGHRKPYRDSRTFAQTAFDFQAALVKLKDMLDDCESQTGATELARPRAVDAIETLRQTWDVGSRNSFAGIYHNKLNSRATVIRRCRTM